MSVQAVVSICGLSKVFERAGVTALEDIELEVEQGRVRLTHRAVRLR